MKLHARRIDLLWGKMPLPIPDHGGDLQLPALRRSARSHLRSAGTVGLDVEAALARAENFQRAARSKRRLALSRVYSIPLLPQLRDHAARGQYSAARIQAGGAVWRIGSFVLQASGVQSDRIV